MQQHGTRIPGYAQRRTDNSNNAYLEPRRPLDPHPAVRQRLLNHQTQRRLAHTPAVQRLHPPPATRRSPSAYGSIKPAKDTAKTCTQMHCADDAPVETAAAHEAEPINRGKKGQAEGNARARTIPTLLDPIRIDPIEILSNSDRLRPMFLAPMFIITIEIHYFTCK